jgi:hypothetical protein
MAFAPTHRAPDEGLDAYAAPDPAPGAAAQIPGGLEIEVIERRADWAQVRTGNGWEGWVDGRRVVELPVAPPVATPPPVVTPPPPPTPTPTPAPPTPPAPPVAATPPPTVAEPVTPAASWGTPPTVSPPPAGAAPAWAAPVAGPASTSRFGAGSIVALVGAAIVLLSSFLDWFDFAVGESSFKVTVKSLWSVDDYGADDGLSIGILLLALVVLIVVGALVKPARILALIGAVLVLVTAVLYMVTSARATNEANDILGTDLSVADVAGFGAFLVFIGAIISVVGGFLLVTQKK